MKRLQSEQKQAYFEGELAQGDYPFLQLLE